MIADAGPRFAIRRTIDRLGTWASVAAVILAIIPLLSVLVFVFQRGASTISWSFITTDPPPPLTGMKGGMWSSLQGTLEIVAMTSLIGIPIGMLSGIFLATSQENWFTKTVRFTTDIIAGLPSILAGILVSALVVSQLHSPSGFAASIALAFLMFPTVTRATDAALSAVPPELREAALGLGSPEWKTVFRVLIPTASSGIVTAIILGIARVAGETAPLIFTLGILGFYHVNFDVLHGFIGAIPGQIYQDTQSGFASDKNAAFAAAFVLFFLVMFLNLLARALTYRLAKRTRVV